MLVLRLAAVTVGLPLIAFFFGWSLLGRFTRLNMDQRFAASWGVSFAAMGGCQLVVFLLQADQTRCNLIVLAVMLAVSSACWLTTARTANDGPSSWPLAALWSLGYLHLLLIQALLPIYEGGDWFGDWAAHYYNALTFRGVHDPHTPCYNMPIYSVAARTELFNLAAAFVMSLVGDEFWAFQTASTLMNYVFVAALYLVLRRLCGPRAASLALILAPLNLWMLHIAWFTWPKMLAAHYVALGLAFYLRFLEHRATNLPAARLSLLLCWTSSLLGYMTHQVAAVYIVAILVHLAILMWRERTWLISAKDMGLAAIVAGIILVPWYGWLYYEFGREQIGATPVTLMDTSAKFGPRDIVEYMSFEGFVSVVPTGLGKALFTEPITFHGVYQGLTLLYFDLFTGALTLSMTLFLIVVGVRKLIHLNRQDFGGLRDPAWSAVWLFVLFGVLGGLALVPSKFPHGCAHAALFPAVIVLVGLAWGVLSHRPPRWVALVSAGATAESLAMLWSHLYLVHVPLFLDPYAANLRDKHWQHMVFLYDLLDPFGHAVVQSAAIAVELALGLVLIAQVRSTTRPPSRVPAELAPTTAFRAVEARP